MKVYKVMGSPHWYCMYTIVDDDGVHWCCYIQREDGGVWRRNMATLPWKGKAYHHESFLKRCRDTRWKIREASRLEFLVIFGCSPEQAYKETDQLENKYEERLI